jgi:hypothetical protein
MGRPEGTQALAPVSFPSSRRRSPPRPMGRLEPRALAPVSFFVSPSSFSSCAPTYRVLPSWISSPCSTKPLGTRYAYATTREQTTQDFNARLAVREKSVASGTRPSKRHRYAEFPRRAGDSRPPRPSVCFFSWPGQLQALRYINLQHTEATYPPLAMSSMRRKRSGRVTWRLCDGRRDAGVMLISVGNL